MNNQQNKYDEWLDGPDKGRSTVFDYSTLMCLLIMIFFMIVLFITEIYHL